MSYGNKLTQQNRNFLPLPGCNTWFISSLFLSAPQNKIRLRYFLHPQLPEHRNNLTAVVGAMIKKVQQHLVDRLFKPLLFEIVIDKLVLQRIVMDTRNPIHPLLVQLLQLGAQVLHKARKCLAGNLYFFLQLHALPPDTFCIQNMQVRLHNAGETAFYSGFLLFFKKVQNACEQ